MAATAVSEVAIRSHSSEFSHDSVAKCPVCICCRYERRCGTPPTRGWDSMPQNTPVPGRCTGMSTRSSIRRDVRASERARWQPAALCRQRGRARAIVRTTVNASSLPQIASDLTFTTHNDNEVTRKTGATHTVVSRASASHFICFSDSFFLPAPVFSPNRLIFWVLVMSSGGVGVWNLSWNVSRILDPTTDGCLVSRYELNNALLRPRWTEFVNAVELLLSRSLRP